MDVRQYSVLWEVANNIAALCYALEEFSRLKTTHKFVASTSQLQTWNQPRKRTLEPQSVEEIKFEHGKAYRREHQQPAYDPRPPQLLHTTNNGLKMLHDKLLSFGKPCGFLHVNSPSSQSPHVSTKSLLPPIPHSIKEKVLVKMRGLDHPMIFFP